MPGYEVGEYLLNKWERKCAYCGVENIAWQVEHIYHPRAKGASNRISNLCLACPSCNRKKGFKNIEQFLAKKPDILKRILAQAKRPLKDAAVNSTRWALFNRLKETGLPVVTGSGGLTKFNRTRLQLPKTHWLDVGCVGQVESLEVLTHKPLLIKSTGHPTRQIGHTDKFGFASRYVPRNKPVKGFQTVIS